MRLTPRTEYGAGNVREIKQTLSELQKRNLITPDMVFLSRWDFREKAPVATETQDVVVFSLTGNYATKDEQPLILREIARCVRAGGYMIASTLSSSFDFAQSGHLLNVLKFIFKTPLGWPAGLSFMKWQINWANMAARMNREGHWANLSADVWAGFLRPAGMKMVRIYEAPCNLVPVEVLVTRKDSASDTPQGG